ncbi:MAG: hypothetical protein L0219_14655, partial [Phycisphaerales bacterium]|nr:hypothetical protein [Phycisphaerales bacterium]
LDDGTICFHKFQRRAHEILKRYRAFDPAAFAVEGPNLNQYRNQWLAEPVRNQYLLGPYGVYSSLPATLREQNLDPTSPWFGSTYVWRGPDGQSRRDHPWTWYNRLGLSHVAEHITVFGAVYAIDEPFNPLFKSAALRDRIIIGALQELMMLQEHEGPQAQITHYYGGERAFSFSRDTRVFPWVIGDCPADVREVWTAGLRRYVDRMSISQVAGVVNQWTPIIVGFQNFFEGSKDPTYSTLVQRHLRWLMTRNFWGMGRREAGYFDECEGPDASYNGITNHNLAWIYERTRDPALLEALRRCVDLFNHTVAPEPSASLLAKPAWLGSCSFNHRIPKDWTQTQSGSGLAMLFDDFPEAAPLAGRAWLAWPTPRHSGELAKARTDLANMLRYLDMNAFSEANKPAAIAGSSELLFSLWEHYARPFEAHDLPVVAEDRFTRNFGDEFFCVRRPNYYAFIYAGRTMSPWLNVRRPKDPHRQHPRNGGGLCMFWSPSFGSSILSKNWSAYAAHTIIAENALGGGGGSGGGSGGADWEDYWSIQSAFDQDRSEATIGGSLRDQPIGFERKYRFMEDHVECDLTLRATAGANFSAMWECFPYPLDKPQRMSVTLLDGRGRPVQDQPATAVKFQTGADEVHLIVFSKPRRCQVGVDKSVDDLNEKHEYGRVLAELPATWQEGQSHTVRWSMMAVPARRVPQAIRDAFR